MLSRERPLSGEVIPISAVNSVKRQDASSGYTQRLGQAGGDYLLSRSYAMHRKPVRIAPAVVWVQSSPNSRLSHTTKRGVHQKLGPYQPFFPNHSVGIEDVCRAKDGVERGPTHDNFAWKNNQLFEAWFALEAIPVKCCPLN